MSRFETLPDALRLLRESRGYSQRQVAEAVGVHPTAVGSWERGERWPTLKRFGQLADFLDLDLGDFDDALEIAGWRPARRRRPPAAAEPDLDPRRLARRALRARGALPFDAAESELTRLLASLFALMECLRETPKS